MATTKVSALPSKPTLTGGEEILINDGGTSKKSTVAAVTATNTAAILLNTAKVTNATHTGDVTGSGALTIADDAVITAKILDDNVTADKLANSINTEIAANTAKTGITGGQASAITANTAKTGITGGQASAITANTAKVTNATHTGEVTGSGALTIADDVVDEANLKVSNAPVNGYVLTAQSGDTGGLTWAVDAGGSNVTAMGLWEHNHTISANYSITSGNNAITAGPITIDTGYSVTVPTGSTWVIA